MHLSQNDPDLGLIVSGEAPVELELAVMDGTLLDSVPSAAEREKAATAARVAEILAQHPGGRDGYYGEDGKYVDRIEPSFTLLSELAQLDHQAWQREELKRNPPAAEPGAVTEEGAAYANARLASLNAGVQG